MNKETEPNRKLNNSTIGLMFSVALFFDALQASLQFIWIVGQLLAGLVALFAFLTFWMWFKLYGMNFSTPKRSAIMGTSLLIEIIPVLNILPAWTLAITLMIAEFKIKSVKQEESGENKKAV